mgnify:FL=1
MMRLTEEIGKDNRDLIKQELDTFVKQNQKFDNNVSKPKYNQPIFVDILADEILDSG